MNGWLRRPQSKDWRLLDIPGRMYVAFGYYDNWTNYRGSTYLHTNIRLGPLHVHAAYDHCVFDEDEVVGDGHHRDREVRIRISAGKWLGFRGTRFNLSWHTDL